MDPQLRTNAESLASRMAQLSPEKRILLEKLLAAESTIAPSAPPISKRASSENIPLSFAQQRLWFLDQLLPGSSIYNIPWAMRLTIPLDVAILEKSLNEIVRRHETLRTTFASVDGQPVQVIAPSLDLELSVVDLDELPLAEREVEAIRLAGIEAQQPFDLAQGPLLRTSLLRLGHMDHVLLLTMHHVVTDGWSMDVLFQELTALYNAFALGRPSPLPDLAIQYADYAVWQRQWLQGEALASQLGYWEQQLRQLPLLQMPTDRPRPAVQTFRGAEQRFEINTELTKELQQLSQREGVTLFMTLLAVFNVLLSRYTGQDDIVVGSPIAGRNRAEIEGLIGFFVNTLVLRTKLAGANSFREVLRRVRDVCVGAFAHQEVPFEMLVEKLQPERDLARNPLFQVMLQLQSEQRATQNNQPQNQASFEISRASAIFDMAFNLWETGTELKGQIEFNTDLFEASTMARLAQHYCRLLEAVVRQPDAEISRLPLLSPKETAQVLEDWNQTAAEYPRERCIHQLFEQQVAQRPAAVALRFGEQEISYRELNRRANQLAHYLRRQGIGSDTLVGVMVERSVAMIVSVLAVLKAGAAYVPLDPGYPAERLKYMIADAGIGVVLTQATAADKLSGSEVWALDLEKQAGEIAQEAEDNPELPVIAENLAYVIYTSGSTGKPKGVMVPHRGLINVAENQFKQFGLKESDRVLQFSSLSFDASMFEILMAVRAGAAICLLSLELTTPGLEFATLLREEAVSIVTLPPSALMALPDTYLPALRTITVAGEACPAEVVARWATGRRFYNLYGPTEASIWSSVAECTNGNQKPNIGRATGNTQLYILDRHLQPCPINVVGELFIGGDGLARGYLKRPALTAEKFIPHPFSTQPGARLYRTGDLALFLADGNIQFAGRVDDQVKLRGYRIELGEIEEVLKKQRGVQEAVVAMHADATGGNRLAAYLVTNEAHNVGELRASLRMVLPEYMIPASFTVLEELPRTPNGKIDRLALPALDTVRPQLQDNFVAPRTQTEQEIAKLWEKILSISPVGVYDNFFDLGGHSLLATQLVSQLRERFQVTVPLRRLFETPTVAGLVESIELMRWASQGSGTSDSLPGEYEEGDV